MTPAEISAKIAAAPLRATYFGLRVEDGRQFAVGEYLPDSRVWVDGEPQDDEIDGCCAIDLGDAPTTADIEDAINRAANYHGTTLVLIAGPYRSHGQDAGETIIRKAECLACWQR